jgi:hypothetical protein
MCFVVRAVENKRTEEQRNKGTAEQTNKGTKEQTIDP